MVEKTNEDFLFSIKANQGMTHQRENNATVFEAFCQMLEPVFTDNHWRGQAVRSIRQLRMMLD